MPGNSDTDRDVCVMGMSRTPLGCFLGKLSRLSAVELGSAAIKSAVTNAGLASFEGVEEVLMGNVLSANLGQNPARQAALAAGIGSDVPCTTINKVCASGMKATSLGAQAILCGWRDVVVVGGMESMSNVPHYMPVRRGTKFGSVTMEDGIQKDGLTDAYDHVPMGDFAELCSTEHNISRHEQDTFAAESYRRSRAATESGKFKNEITPIKCEGRLAGVVDQDEEPTIRQVSLESLSKLRPVFRATDGTVTAGNASPISDGAAALVLMSRKKANELGLSIRFVLRGAADVAQDAKHFTTSPAIAVNEAINLSGLKKVDDVDVFEINEAFSVVGIANMKILGLDPERVNVYGGAVSMGHPLGCSGARIIVTLATVMSQEGGRYGCAAVCNGGGGASALIIERMNCD